ncbi:MAG: AAA family ATPase [Lachnospiraceae bacterium]|nr:AAA family ATPase [Lachnospiraceae bacterium]
MGIYLNPGNEVFRRVVSADIYVDKSMLLDATNKMLDSANNYICMSRPRRFGKTVTGNMIAAYYSKGCDSRELFSGLKISKTADYEEHLNRHNVIKVDVNSEFQNISNKAELIRKLTDKINDEIRQEYSNITLDSDDTLAEAIMKVYSATGDTFIILLDEYDVLVREQVSDNLFNEFLGFLNGLFKSDTLRPAISLAYITGILPVVRDKVQSKLNNFREYTFLNAGRFAEFVGYTSDEVEELCEKYSVDYEECRHWYDGYSQNGYEIYNPESVVMCIEERGFDGYWGRTSTYAAIADRIRQNFKGTKEDIIRMLAGESVDVNVTRYMNTMDSFNSRSDVFTYLIHLGYLAYDNKDKTCRIPNREVRQEWFNAIEDIEDYNVTNEIIESSKELLNMTIALDGEAVSRALDISHIHVSSNRSYNNEDVLQSAIYLAYIYALNKYTIIKEMTTGKGFADVVFIPYVPDMPAMVIELKHNKSSESALSQIKEKQYFDSLSNYSGRLLLVGINYDEDKKTHVCQIEKWEK